MLSVVFFHKSEDLAESFLEHVFEFLIDLDSFDDVFVALPDNLESVSQFLEFLLFFRSKT